MVTYPDGFGCVDPGGSGRRCPRLHVCSVLMGVCGHTSACAAVTFTVLFWVAFMWDEGGCVCAELCRMNDSKMLEWKDVEEV